MKTSPSARSRSIDNKFPVGITAGQGRSGGKACLDQRSNSVRGHSLLEERIAVAQRDRSIFHRLSVDGQAVRRANFVLAAIASADRARLIVKDREARAQF